MNSEQDFAIIKLLERGYIANSSSLLGVRLSQSDAERPAALGSEAKRNGDGRAQYCLSRSQRVLFRIFLYYRLADCGINETR